jgi:NagD protein
VLSGATDAARLATLEGAARPDVALADVAELLDLLTPTLSTPNTPVPSEGARS